MVVLEVDTTGILLIRGSNRMQSAFTDQECSNVLQPSTPERFVRFTNQSFYDVVFALTAQPGRYRAVPASKRCLDS